MWSVLTSLLLLVAICNPAYAQAISIFSGTPKTPIDPDTNAVTLGLRFNSAQAGTIKGIRFYRASKSAKGYVARLYTSSGQRLATVAVAADPCNTMPCWEELDFATPVSIVANTTYVAAYFAPSSHYPDDQDGLASPVVNGPLTALADGGVYHYGTSIGFPTQVWNSSNYWVDVSFVPGVSPPPPPPTLSLSFSPPNPTIASTAAPGTLVATATATWSNGAAFTGTYGFAAPNTDDNGTFALVNGNQIIINPAGPGVGADGGTTQNLTVQAVQ